MVCRLSSSVIGLDGCGALRLGVAYSRLAWPWEPPSGISGTTGLVNVSCGLVEARRWVRTPHICTPVQAGLVTHASSGSVSSSSSRELSLSSAPGKVGRLLGLERCILLDSSPLSLSSSESEESDESCRDFRAAAFLALRSLRRCFASACRRVNPMGCVGFEFTLCDGPATSVRRAQGKALQCCHTHRHHLQPPYELLASVLGWVRLTERHLRGAGTTQAEPVRFEYRLFGYHVLVCAQHGWCGQSARRNSAEVH